jgi:hypothetical protein
MQEQTKVISADGLRFVLRFDGLENGRASGSVAVQRAFLNGGSGLRREVVVRRFGGDPLLAKAALGANDEFYVGSIQVSLDRVVAAATWDGAGVSCHDAVAAFQPASHHLQVCVPVASRTWTRHIVQNNSFHREVQMPFHTADP